MAFPPVPNYSRSQIARAGYLLAHQDKATPAQIIEATEIVSAWRACHAYPINTFQATLRDKVRHKYKDPIVAQRLKRMPTIIDKLQRHKDMQLPRMQDIGGLRVVVKSVDDAYKLTKEYKKSKFTHRLVGEKDYIECPRDNDGYRSIHLIYKYETRREGAQYSGLLVELQIRSRLQHTWATAVETMGTLLGQALKSGRGDKEWLDFFAITSSAFAHIEKTTPIPRYSNLSKAETFQAVGKAVEELKVLEKIEQYSMAMNHITNRSSAKWAYYLITLRSIDGIVELHSYGRGELQEATEDYEAAEKRAEAGEKIESVLVSAGPLTQLKIAYPNYFLDITEFIRRVKEIIK
jgi:putative GTP pyrophosphokinase